MHDSAATQRCDINLPGDTLPRAHVKAFSSSHLFSFPMPCQAMADVTHNIRHHCNHNGRSLPLRCPFVHNQRDLKSRVVVASADVAARAESSSFRNSFTCWRSVWFSNSSLPISLQRTLSPAESSGLCVLAQSLFLPGDPVDPGGDSLGACSDEVVPVASSLRFS